MKLTTGYNKREFNTRSSVSLPLPRAPDKIICSVEIASSDIKPTVDGCRSFSTSRRCMELGVSSPFKHGPFVWLFVCLASIPHRSNISAIEMGADEWIYTMSQHLSAASAADVYAAVTLLYSAVNSSKGQTIIKLIITKRFEPSLMTLIFSHRL